jgi:ketosteroid isomerase-like protein
MTTIAVSRRYLVAAGAAGALVGASGVAGAQWVGGRGMTHQELIRKWYAAWEKPDWGPLDLMLADDFTFTSAAGDDHISKSEFKSRCWQSQIGFIERFELEQVFGSGDEALVKYLCRTKNGKSFRNVEYLRFKENKLASIECYFGEESSFPSAVSAGQKAPSH